MRKTDLHSSKVAYLHYSIYLFTLFCNSVTSCLWHSKSLIVTLYQLIKNDFKNNKFQAKKWTLVVRNVQVHITEETSSLAGLTHYKISKLILLHITRFYDFFQTKILLKLSRYCTKTFLNQGRSNGR